MKRYVLSLVLAVFSAILFACGGCGSSDSGSGGGGGIAAVAISADGLSDGTLAAPKGRPMALRLEGRDASGAAVAVDGTQVTWESDSPAFTVNGGTLTANQDWFDASGTEPSGTLTARLGDKTATAALVGVIDADGAWKATLDTGTSLNLSLSQSGRTVTDAVTHVSGTIRGDALSFSFSGFQVDAKFVSRTEADGTYSGAGAHGTLVCTRSP